MHNTSNDLSKISNRQWGNIILVATGFAVYYLLFKNFEPVMLWLKQWVQNGLASYFLTYVIVGIPVFISTCIINRSSRFLKYLGLQSIILQGFIVAIICTLPMFIGGFITNAIASDISAPQLIASTLFAGFFEELYFRGFFFGQLFRKTPLGFLPSVLLCSIIFASGHLYQSQDLATLTGIFLTTFMGSLLFAWLYVEWNYNLWVPIFLHSLMNLCWEIFTVSDNALGSVNANVFRAITIALAIIVTIKFKKRSGEKLRINKKTMLWQRN